MITVVEEGELSENWEFSTSGRYGGGIFIPSIIQELMSKEIMIATLEGEERDQRKDILAAPGTSRTYQEFTAAVKYATLKVLGVRLPKLPVFAAQQIQMERPVQSLPGQYPNQYQARFETLRTTSPSNVNPLVDRSRRPSDISDEELDQGKTRHPNSNEEVLGSPLRGQFGPRIHPRVVSNARYLAQIPGVQSPT